jgi:hypothetical protein
MSNIEVSWLNSFKIFWSIFWRSFIYTIVLIIFIVLLVLGIIVLLSYINPQLLVSLGAIFTINISQYFLSLQYPSFTISYVSIYIIFNILIFIIYLFISKKVLSLTYKKISIKLIDNQNNQIIKPSFKNSFKFTFYYFIILALYNLTTLYIQTKYMNIDINNINYSWTLFVWISSIVVMIYAIKRALEYKYRDFSICLVPNEDTQPNKNVENENITDKIIENKSINNETSSIKAQENIIEDK